jgi:hypothetical protein
MFDDLRALAARERGSRAASEVEELAWRHLREAEPIRVSHAQRLLGVSNQTVREWMNSWGT